jgi:hypothetical protein
LALIPSRVTVPAAQIRRQKFRPRLVKLQNIPELDFTVNKKEKMSQLIHFDVLDAL